jgi:hypothetical protein
MRESVKVSIPARMAWLANVWRRVYGPVFAIPAASRAGYQFRSRQLWRSRVPPRALGAKRNPKPGRAEQELERSSAGRLRGAEQKRGPC